MKKTYAVAIISFFDNELEIHFKQAESWFDALAQVNADYTDHFTDYQKEDQEEAKRAAFDGDWMFSVEEVP